MGTIDPTENHCLKENQVCIIHENGQITGDVLVYRNPGLHFGDIHIMQATHVEGLESYVGHGKYAIFFPCVGPRSVADEIAGGDFDGDMYWVSKNPQVVRHISFYCGIYILRSRYIYLEKQKSSRSSYKF